MVIDVYVQVCVSIECTDTDDSNPKILSVYADGTEPIYSAHGDAFIQDSEEWIATRWDQRIKAKAYEAVENVLNYAQESDLNPESQDNAQ